MSLRCNREEAFSFTDTFTGLAAADAVAGLASLYRVGSYGEARLAGSYRILASLYVNDNFRVNRKLTLNMGVRWDPGTHSRDKFRVDGTRWMSWPFPGQQSQRFPNAPPGWLYWGDPGTPDTNAFARLNQFAPPARIRLRPERDRQVGGPRRCRKLFSVRCRQAALRWEAPVRPLRLMPPATSTS